MTKTEINRKKAAKEFAEKWRGKGYEKGESQLFWIDLLEHVYNVENISDFIIFEDKVHLDHTSFIDAYIPSTHVMIEQKSCGKDLLKPIKQSDGSLLTPFQQAKRYVTELPLSQHPRWIITCNFQEFLIYDMEKPQGEPVQVLLEDLPNKFEYLQFMIDTKKTSVSPEEQISLKAGELVGKLYDALIKEYINPDENSFRSLNILCVRIVFCLYAEDAGLFETRTSFEDYIKSFNLPDLRDGILKLFKALDTKPENRDKYDLKLKAFPYVNGGLFAAKDIEVPNFSDEIVNIIVNHCAPFDWSEISPTIFGAVFESTLNPETRRKGGMHYTSIANIHKVIDPLFLDDLRKEFHQIVEPFPETAHKPKTTIPSKETYQVTSLRKRRELEQFRNKIANLKFLDPACGSGNFLTETYISLRRLENEILKKIHGKQQLLGSDFSPIKVKISQFYGIEINDFAVTVAKTALWIAESQMMKETEEIVEENLDFLPLSTSATIVEGNALRMDWRYLCEEEKIPTIKAKKTNLIYEVHEAEIKYEAINLITDEINVGKPQQKKTENHYDYIMGNPPFVGARMMEQGGEQKKDIQNLFGSIKDVQDLDYVCGWYRKAAELIQNTKTEAAFVSTNSICQGSQVPILWNVLMNNFGIKINFAYQAFKWDSESTEKAAVHCVIVGFADFEREKKELFSVENNKKTVKNISPYLIDSDDIYVSAQKEALCDVPKMNMGNMARDGGHFFLSIEEKEEIVKKHPELEKWIHPLIGAEEFIKGKKRFCFWLNGISPAEVKSNKILYERVEAVKQFRLASNAKTTQGYAKNPYIWAQICQPDTDFIVVPVVSSERRKYVPIGFLSPENIPTTQVQIIPNANLYHLGVLTSSVHMAWMRVVAGRLKSDYRYSKEIVYNTFPWCNPTEKQKAKIEATAQQILDVRSKYPECSFAVLYDETTMPADLRKAHKENDKAVMSAYGFSPKMSESEIVTELFKMYEKLTKKK